MPTLLAMFLVFLILPIIFAIGIVALKSDSEVSGVIISLLSGAAWAIIAIAALTPGEPTIKSIKTYGINEISAPGGKVQVALVEGKLINITKHFKILFENPEDSWLSVTTYDECYNWICYDGTVFMDQPTYEVVRAEQNVIPND